MIDTANKKNNRNAIYREYVNLTIQKVILLYNCYNWYNLYILNKTNSMIMNLSYKLSCDSEERNSKTIFFLTRKVKSV